MISSFHAVFGLRQGDKSAKVIDYNDQVIRVSREPWGRDLNEGALPYKYLQGRL